MGSKLHHEVFMDSLMANAARVEITPDRDISLAGEVGWFRPGKYVDSPLYARALVLASGDTKQCFISLDVTIVTEAVSARIREAIARDQGIPPEAVMVHATQVHAAPALGVFMFDRDFPPVPDELEWLAGGVRAYEDYAVDRILAAVREAAADLQPARLRAGSGIEGRIQFNRRAITDDGTARMPGPSWPQPLGPTYIRYLEGPTDPEVGVLCVAESLRPPDRVDSAPHGASGKRVSTGRDLSGLARCLGGGSGAAVPALCGTGGERMLRQYQSLESL